MYTPCEPLPSGSVPVASVPIRLKSAVLPPAPAVKKPRPTPLFPERRLPSTGWGPPTVLPAVAKPNSTPLNPFGIALVPLRFVPT